MTINPRLAPLRSPLLAGGRTPEFIKAAPAALPVTVASLPLREVIDWEGSIDRCEPVRNVFAAQPSSSPSSEG